MRIFYGKNYSDTTPNTCDCWSHNLAAQVDVDVKKNKKNTKEKTEYWY
jgi:hypothetical protein